MSVGRILTQGIGSFGGRRYLPTMGLGSFAGAIPDPSQSGWISRTAIRLSVSSKQQRVALFSPQQRVWIARSDNE
jgi:hypothetical protein